MMSFLSGGELPLLVQMKAGEERSTLQLSGEIEQINRGTIANAIDVPPSIRDYGYK
jgi:hypothetical protein